MPQNEAIPADIDQKAQKRAQVKRWFEANGLSVTDWATARGFKREQVYAVLNGRSTGRRGAAHRIAVELGLKTPEGPPTLVADPYLPSPPAASLIPGSQEPDRKDRP
jgi:gp16 family phage-associated protein